MGVANLFEACCLASLFLVQCMRSVNNAFTLVRNVYVEP